MGLQRLQSPIGPETPRSIDFDYNRNDAEKLQSVEHKQSADCRADEEQCPHHYPSQKGERHQYHKNGTSDIEDARREVSTF
jgi:hypothetical protein